MLFTTSVSVSNRDIASRLREEVVRQINLELKQQGLNQFSDFRVDEDKRVWGKHGSSWQEVPVGHAHYGRALESVNHLKHFFAP